jgi:hypothetical protein
MKKINCVVVDYILMDIKNEFLGEIVLTEFDDYLKDVMAEHQLGPVE